MTAGGSSSGWRPWERAWHDALYGTDGFYRRPEGPAGHFRTAAHASSGGLLGAALARLARRAGCTAVLDVGAGRGELLSAVHAADPGLRCTGVDVVDRPDGLASEVAWSTRPPVPDAATLLVGWELLDVVPAPVLEVDDAGTPREVQVDARGAERLGPPASEEQLAWCRRWWPLQEPGQRAEVGAPREQVWAGLVDLLGPHGGLALAVDYGHDRADRPPHGSLTGYARGRQVAPVPDGSCDVTAHVALDALAATRPGARLSQRSALLALGVAASRPPMETAGRDPARYLAGLAAAGEAAELLDPAGLGGFGWVLHPVGAAAASAVEQLTADVRVRERRPAGARPAGAAAPAARTPAAPPACST